MLVGAGNGRTRSRPLLKYYIRTILFEKTLKQRNFLIDAQANTWLVEFGGGCTEGGFPVSGKRRRKAGYKDLAT